MRLFTSLRSDRTRPMSSGRVGCRMRVEILGVYTRIYRTLSDYPNYVHELLVVR